MASSNYSVCTRPRGCNPDAVRCLRVSPALLELYLAIRERSDFIDVLGEVLPTSADRMLTLEAVEARFEALAAWLVGTEPSDRPAGATDWFAICVAMAETDLDWDGRLFRFDHGAFKHSVERARRKLAEA